MAPDDTAGLAAFRAEVEAFAREACPPHIRDIVRRHDKLTRAEWSVWQDILYRRGWGAPGWPVEWGGTGWNVRQRFVFEETMARFDCPVQYHHGLGHIGPVLMRFGTDAQRQRYLPPILAGTDWWCQGYSEPGAGSDLASLKTRAEPTTDGWIVNGQKIWTSHAHEADLMYALVRTSTEGRRQDGISMLLIPLDSPGVTVRPIRTIDGLHHLNEVFFDDVRVPADHLVGEAGGGWRCAKFLLERERLPPAGVPRLIRLWQSVARLVERQAARDDGRQAAALRPRVLMAEAELKAARELLADAVDDLLNGRPLGAKPSILKLHTGELGQRIVGIALDAVGPVAAGGWRPADPQAPLDDDAVWVQNYLFYRSRTLAGGTSEVQRNVIARDLFGA